jgi:hypothetical protein
MTFVARNIDEVLAQLELIIEASSASHSRLGYFAALYRQVTLEVKRGIASGRFEDGPRMDRFDTAFGNRYFAALHTWEQGEEPPKCWQIAFDLLTNDDTIILQHLLLGVNAHINLDLAVAAVEAVPEGGLLALWRDYEQINDILADVLDRLQAVVDELSPFMYLLDDVGGRSDEHAMDFSIRTAREEAWANAQLLAAASPAHRLLLLRKMDVSASFLARLIARPAGILIPALELIRNKENQDIAEVIDRLDNVIRS